MLEPFCATGSVLELAYYPKMARRDWRRMSVVVNLLTPNLSLLQSGSIQITQIECCLCGPGLVLIKLENNIVDSYFDVFEKVFYFFCVNDSEFHEYCELESSCLLAPIINSPFFKTSY